MTKNVNKLIVVFFILIAGFLIYRQQNIQEFFSKNQVTPTPEVTPSIAPAAQLEFEVTGGNDQQKSYEFIATNFGQNALELIENQAKLELKKYDFGVMIEGVNGLMADNKNYWAIYLNGEYAKTGIAQIELQKNDKIELKYEEITY